MSRILIIEDEVDIRNNLLRLLRVEGFEVMGAENGRAGLACVCSFCPDLIISDVGMPELDGHGVLAALRADPSTASIPFIFLTAMADPQDFRAGLKLGADDYLTKPFTRGDVLDSIHSRFARQNAVAVGLRQQLDQLKSELRQNSHIDAVTGLKNRFALAEAFVELAARNVPLTAVCVGLDRFVEISAGLTPAGADALLVQIAGRLMETAPSSGQICRLAGGTFLLVLSDLSGCMLDKSMDALRHAIRQPFFVEEKKIILTASIGTARYPDHAEQLDRLVGNAQAEMTRARSQGGDNCCHYDPAVSMPPQDRLDMESALHQAVAAGELFLQYQPQVCLTSGAVIGVEALVRWRHPVVGLISPARFIPLAEENGAILEIGEWVMQTACRQARLWMDAGLPRLKMGVNISARQLRQQDLVALVEKVLGETGLPAEYLDIEVTESVLVHNAQLVAAVLGRIKALGVSVSIDDFGTGYSSMAYLQKMPFDKLKIDRSFISGLPDEQNAAIVRALLAMASQLGMETIAEGVETGEELSFLKEAGCGQLQGFLFSRPLFCDDVVALMRRSES
ncbi:EAL domain-containing protein [Candidatus Methylospira mobilis]|uniref:EAL domain-containing response regulator n=1 Tax=Candidatus Methylospira mobilis TaxID=1808979 RepID=UPI0028EAB1DF|nr:EAL domain-containing protein [Candidatus Methylospira mobilis]WNV04689.1 EAL domain-containing protein [Candidatus Methylospira mobilis]